MASVAQLAICCSGRLLTRALLLPLRVQQIDPLLTHCAPSHSPFCPRLPAHRTNTRPCNSTSSPRSSCSCSCAAATRNRCWPWRAAAALLSPPRRIHSRGASSRRARSRSFSAPQPIQPQSVQPQSIQPPPIQPQPPLSWPSRDIGCGAASAAQPPLPQPPLLLLPSPLPSPLRGARLRVRPAAALLPRRH